MSALKLALAPLPYYWTQSETVSFYRDIAQSAVDIVYLGETVCSRRHEMRLEDWLALAQDLAAAGKEVVLSTQTLIESESELKTLRRIVEQTDFRVEANDMGAVRLLIEHGRKDWIAGPALNIFNTTTLALMTGEGATRWVAPPEMSREVLTELLAAPAVPETEITAYGRLPLAYSARCFTARHFNLQKDACEFRCLDFPDGLLLKTREEQPFLALNGTQTQSAATCNLLNELPRLRQCAQILRIVPQHLHCAEIIALFRSALEANETPAQAYTRSLALMPASPCNGFWYGRAGIEHILMETPP